MAQRFENSSMRLAPMTIAHLCVHQSILSETVREWTILVRLVINCTWRTSDATLPQSLRTSSWYYLCSRAPRSTARVLQ